MCISMIMCRAVCSTALSHMKTERVTLLTTKEFKLFLSKEARRQGVSVAEVIRSGFRTMKIKADRIPGLYRLAASGGKHDAMSRNRG
jgi:hypothetical protein